MSTLQFLFEKQHAHTCTKNPHRNENEYANIDLYMLFKAQIKIL